MISLLCLCIVSIYRRCLNGFRQGDVSRLKDVVHRIGAGLASFDIYLAGGRHVPVGGTPLLTHDVGSHGNVRKACHTVCIGLHRLIDGIPVSRGSL